MKNQIKKGRPPKEKGAAKREHFSVWVSSDQKSQINQLIEKSGLSASQFFLTLALDIPFKKPQKDRSQKPSLTLSGFWNSFQASCHWRFSKPKING